MKNLFLSTLLIVSLLSNTSRAQTDDNQLIPSTSTQLNTSKKSGAKLQNNVSIELLGRGFLYSLAYDRQISQDIAVGGSFSYMMTTFKPAVVETKVQIVSLPLYMNYYFNQGHHRFLATGGLNLFWFEAKANLTQQASETIQGQQQSDNPVVLPDFELSGSGLIPIPQVGIGYEYKSRGG